MKDGDYEDLKYDKFVESKQARPTCVCPHCKVLSEINPKGPFGHLKWVDGNKVRAYVAEMVCPICDEGFYVAEPDTELHQYLKGAK